MFGYFLVDLQLLKQGHWADKSKCELFLIPKVRIKDSRI